MTRTASARRLSRGPDVLNETDGGLTLRVIWPIVDDRTFDREAMQEAQRQWPCFVERHNVRLIGAPFMQVVECSPAERMAFGVDRAVLCVAPVEKRPPQAGDAA